MKLSQNVENAFIGTTACADTDTLTETPLTGELPFAKGDFGPGIIDPVTLASPSSLEPWAFQEALLLLAASRFGVWGFRSHG